MFDSLGEATHGKVGSKSISTTNGGRFATTRGVRPTHKSSVDNLAMDHQHRLLVALILAKDPCGSYSIMSLVLVARHHWPRAHILEWGRITVDIQKTLVLCVVQVRYMWVRNSVGDSENVNNSLYVVIK